MRVLLADKIASSAGDTLKRLVDEVIVQPELNATTLPQALKLLQADILVVRSTLVNADCLAASNQLSLVIRAGAGVNTIDVDTASRLGIFVANCPGKNAVAVAELVMGLILALDRHIVHATMDLRAGLWNKKLYGQAQGLKGQRLGVIGFGAIAQEVAWRARSFGVKIQAFTRNGIHPELLEKFAISEAESLESLLRTSDIVSLHIPYQRANHHLIGAEQLAWMKPGAMLINTSRGGLVDDQALAQAVREGRIRAGLDTFEAEPETSQAAFSSELADLRGIIGTPHIGASSEQAETAIGQEVVRIIHEYINLGSVPNCVNIAQDRLAKHRLVLRHYDRVGVLAGVLASLREEGVNVQEMNNIVFASGEAACAMIDLEQAPSVELLERLRQQPEILAADLRIK